MFEKEVDFINDAVFNLGINNGKYLLETNYSDLEKRVMESIVLTKVPEPKEEPVEIVRKALDLYPFHTQANLAAIDNWKRYAETGMYNPMRCSGRTTYVVLLAIVHSLGGGEVTFQGLNHMTANMMTKMFWGYMEKLRGKDLALPKTSGRRIFYDHTINGPCA